MDIKWLLLDNDIMRLRGMMKGKCYLPSLSWEAVCGEIKRFTERRAKEPHGIVNQLHNTPPFILRQEMREKRCSQASWKRGRIQCMHPRMANRQYQCRRRHLPRLQRRCRLRP